MEMFEDITKIGRDHTLDLSNWELNSHPQLRGTVDLRISSINHTNHFYEVMPGSVDDFFLSPLEIALKEPVNQDDNVHRARFLILFGVVFAIFALVVLGAIIIWAIYA